MNNVFSLFLEKLVFWSKMSIFAIFSSLENSRKCKMKIKLKTGFRNPGRNENMKSICIYNHKGGTGKTSMVGAIGVELALKNKKVLMVDTDSQANLSTQFYGKPTFELADVLDSKCKFSDAAVKTNYDNLYLLPTLPLDQGGKLDKWVKNEAAADENRNKIKRLISIIEQFGFDFVIWDFAPAYTELTKKILRASDEVIPVLKLDSFSLSGLNTFFVMLDRLKDGDEKPYFNKLIFNCRDKRIGVQNSLLENMELSQIKKYIIPNDTAFVKSQITKQALQTYPLKDETNKILNEIISDLISEE